MHGCFVLILLMLSLFFFKQKTAYEMRISDWSSDVCSSDLHLPDGGAEVRQVDQDDPLADLVVAVVVGLRQRRRLLDREGQVLLERCLLVLVHEIGRASCRERVCQYV